jgi:hypothetical protein
MGYLEFAANPWARLCAYVISVVASGLNFCFRCSAKLAYQYINLFEPCPPPRNGINLFPV